MGGWHDSIDRVILNCIVGNYHNCPFNPYFSFCTSYKQLHTPLVRYHCFSVCGLPTPL